MKLKPIFPRVGYKLYDTVSAKVDHKRVKKEVVAPPRPSTQSYTHSMPLLQRSRLSPERQEAELKMWRKMLRPQVHVSDFAKSQGELQTMKATA